MHIFCKFHQIFNKEENAPSSAVRSFLVAIVAIGETPDVATDHHTLLRAGESPHGHRRALGWALASTCRGEAFVSCEPPHSLTDAPNLVLWSLGKPRTLFW